MRSNSIEWRSTDEEGQKVTIEAHFFAGRVEWKRQYKRFEARQPFTPTDEDWAELEERAAKRRQRGQISDKIWKVIQKRGQKG